MTRGRSRSRSQYAAPRGTSGGVTVEDVLFTSAAQTHFVLQDDTEPLAVADVGSLPAATTFNQSTDRLLVVQAGTLLRGNHASIGG